MTDPLTSMYRQAERRRADLWRRFTSTGEPAQTTTDDATPDNLDVQDIEARLQALADRIEKARP